MYNPKAFQQDDPALLTEVISHHGFGTFITPHSDSAGGLEITHLPLFLKDGSKLIGHMARVNKHWRLLENNMASTAVFQGPHGYVLPSWYGEGGYVPTWNYVAVHVTGKTRLLENVEETREMLDLLTHQYEQGLPLPWSAQEISEAKIEGLMRGIVGFEMTIEDWQGKFKLSQNKSGPAQQSLKENLEKSHRPEDQALATWMARLTDPNKT